MQFSKNLATKIFLWNIAAWARWSRRKRFSYQNRFLCTFAAHHSYAVCIAVHFVFHIVFSSLYLSWLLSQLSGSKKQKLKYFFKRSIVDRLIIMLKNWKRYIKSLYNVWKCMNIREWFSRIRIDNSVCEYGPFCCKNAFC